MPDDPTIEMQAIEGLRELSPDANFLRELVEIYLQDTPQRMAELEEAIGKNDLPTATRAAHTIKGSSSNFGAIKLTKIAHEIELQGKAGSLADSPPALARLKLEYAAVAEALTRIIEAG